MFTSKSIRILLIFAFSFAWASSPYEASASKHEVAWIERDSSGTAHIHSNAGRKYLKDPSANPGQTMRTVFEEDTGTYGVFSRSSLSDKRKAVLVESSDANLTISWDFANPMAEVSVSVDGEKLGKFNAKFSKTFRTSKPNTSHEIKVVQMADNPRDSTSSTIEALNIVLPGLTQGSGVAAPTILASPLPSYSILRYNTFISDDYVAAPKYPSCNVGTLNDPNTYFFNGNNRDYNPTSASSKTMQSVTINWNSFSTSGSVRVGPSHVYVFTLFGYQYLMTMQAPSTGIYYERYGPVTGTALIHMHGEATNPWCPLAKPIKYDLSGGLERSGSYSFSGTLTRVPNHEFYLTDSTRSSWSTIFRADIDPAQNFNCLNPIVTCNTSGVWTPSYSPHYVN